MTVLNADLFKNCTPHVVRVQAPSGVVELPPAGELARVEAREAIWGNIGDVPVVARDLGDVYIPEPAFLQYPDAHEGEGMWQYLVVSSMVLEAAKATRHRHLSLLLAPDTGPTAVRKDGQVVAVTRFIRA